MEELGEWYMSMRLFCGVTSRASEIETEGGRETEREGETEREHKDKDYIYTYTHSLNFCEISLLELFKKQST